MTIFLSLFANGLISPIFLISQPHSQSLGVIHTLKPKTIKNTLEIWPFSWASLPSDKYPVLYHKNGHPKHLCHISSLHPHTLGMSNTLMTPRILTRTKNYQKYLGNITILLSLFANWFISLCTTPKWAPKPLFLQKPAQLPTPGVESYTGDPRSPNQKPKTIKNT